MIAVFVGVVFLALLVRYGVAGGAIQSAPSPRQEGEGDGSFREFAEDLRRTCDKAASNPRGSND